MSVLVEISLNIHVLLLSPTKCSVFTVTYPSVHIIISQFGFLLADGKWFFSWLKIPRGKVPLTTLHLPLILCPKSLIFALAHPSKHLISLNLNLSLL